MTLRERFEAWAQGAPYHNRNFTRMENGAYAVAVVECEWLAYQAGYREVSVGFAHVIRALADGLE